VIFIEIEKEERAMAAGNNKKKWEEIDDDINSLPSGSLSRDRARYLNHYPNLAIN
jgi:hypothetical protein